MFVKHSTDIIRWRLHLRSSPQRVYDMLTTDAGRAKFWSESAVERDGVIHFEFISGVRTHSRIVERVPHRRFALAYFGSTVGFELEPDGVGGCDLTLTDSGFKPEARDDILPGWLNVLLPLKAAVDFGIDLRNHDPKRTWEQGFVDQ